MEAPIKLPVALNCNSINLPKREELSFLIVRALPKASKIGLDSKTGE